METVVGREHELSLAEEFLNSASTRFSVLMLEGEPGIGKTTVWREVIRSAVARGFLVLSCRPAQAEVKLSLAAVTDLLEPVPKSVSETLPSPQRRALDIALLRAVSSGPPADRRTLATAVRSVLSALSSQRPLVVAIDDIQWLDRASAATLSFALRRLANERIGFLASRRAADEVALRADELLESGFSVKAEIGPLSLAAVHHLLKERLASAPSRSQLVRIHKASGGNPFFALEIGHLLDELGAPSAGAPLPVPRDVQALLARRVAKLPVPTQEVLLAAAALEEPSVETLRVALRRSIGEDLEAAEHAGVAIVDQNLISFAHPLFAAAIVSSATAAEQRRVHRLLAAAVENSEQRARHLALAVDGRDEATALVVEAAASEAFARGAPTAAAELAQLALALGNQDTEAHQRRTLELAEYLFAAGEAGRARDILKGVTSWETWPTKLQGRAVDRLCQLVGDTEDPPSATAFLEHLLRDVPGLGVEARAAILSVLSYVTSEVDATRAMQHADAALELLEPLDGNADPFIHAAALYMRLRTRTLAGQGLDRDAVDRIARIEARLPAQRHGLERASRSVAYWFTHVDELEESRTLLEEQLRDAVDSGHESGELNALVHLALTECWAGRFKRAHDYAADSYELAEALGARLPALLAAEALALVHAHLGNVAEVRAIVERRPAPSPPTRHGTLLFRAALGLVELSLGNNEAADRHLRVGLQAAERMGCLEPGIHRMHANAAEAAIALGDISRGEEIGILLAEHGERTSHRWSLATGARVRALVAAARRDLDAASAAIDEALEFHQQLDMPFEQARTILVKGVIERRARQRGKAKGSFEKALAGFEHMSTALWAERARIELGRVGLRRATAAELTQGERRVAELAAQGLTNREVAAALFMSPKTVEANLSRAYRKLGITSRAELGAQMGGHPTNVGKDPM